MSTIKPTKAVPKIPTLKAGFHGIASHLEGSTLQPTTNMSAVDLVGMTFNMPRSWHIEFKQTAAGQSKNMKDFLMECFDAWKREQQRLQG